MNIFKPEKVQIMGVVNVTPDSFSDGGVYFQKDAAVERGLRLAEEGADYLDIGGESSRPGAEPVSVEEEKRRVLPVIEKLAKSVDIPISVDTYKFEVARDALDAGAGIVNDITAMSADDRMVGLVAARGCPVILMHMQGEPKNMQSEPKYDDLIPEIIEFLKLRADFAEAGGIEKENIWIDPGIGFGKRQKGGFNDNMDILANLPKFKKTGHKLVLGVSRKSFIGRILGDAPAEERLFGSLGASAWAALFGADILRVHDVLPTRQMLALLGAIHSRTESTAGRTA